MNIRHLIKPVMLLMLAAFSTFSLAQPASSVPGKPFQYLQGLLGNLPESVSIFDSNDKKVGTYLGVGQETIKSGGNQPRQVDRLLLGFRGQTSEDEITFVASAGAEGFTVPGRLTQVVPFFETLPTDGTVLSLLNDIKTNCSHNNLVYLYDYYPACTEAVDAYVSHTGVCLAAAPRYVTTFDGAEYSFGGFFSKIIVGEPDATVYKKNRTERWSTPYRYSYYILRGELLEINQEDGSCEPIAIEYNWYDGTVDLDEYEKFGNLYDFYTPPFTVRFGNERGGGR